MRYMQSPAKAGVPLLGSGSRGKEGCIFQREINDQFVSVFHGEITIDHGLFFWREKTRIARQQSIVWLSFSGRRKTRILMRRTYVGEWEPPENSETKKGDLVEIGRMIGSKDTINLGSDHFARFWRWKPNRKINPQYRKIPDIEKGGLIVIHRSLIDDAKNRLRKNKFHETMITFDLPEVRQVFPRGPFWTVVSLDRATLEVSPSLLCDPAKGGCGDHGHIRAGRWVVA